jgi:anti-sigma factor RsiW
MRDDEMRETPRAEQHVDGGTLDRYRTGELAEAERQRVAAHLAACDRCAAALASLEALAGTVDRAYAAQRELGAATEPGWARLRARVSERIAKRGRAAREGWPAWARWAPQAAAAILALIVVGVLWREGVWGPDDARRIAAPRPAVEAERSLPPATQSERDGAELESPAPSEDEGVVRAREAPPVGAREKAAGKADDAAAEAAAQEVDAAAPAPAADAPARYEARGPELRAGVLPSAAIDRFELDARRALSRTDTAAAREALTLWRDTLAPRADLEAGRREQARALADSLASLLDASPE